MNLESEITSLDLAKRLKELGVDQKSFYVWIELYHGPEIGFAPFHRIAMSGENLDVENRWSAFTTGELGEMLPRGAHGAFLNIFKGKNSWAVGYGLEVTFHADTEADARAMMLIYLIENGLIR